jgi:hypothetical protein
MLITFRSGVCTDVMMFGDVARQMMEIMGKEPGDRGVITVDQLVGAAARLRKAVADERALRKGAQPADEEDEEAREHVGIGQRALPLIELLECSLKEEKAVTWGV